MNTNEPNLVREYIPDVKQGGYEFNRFDKASLRSGISAIKLRVCSQSYSNWDMAADKIFREVLDHFRGSQVLCFIASPYWKKLDPLVNYYGLRKSLKKEFGIDLEFLFESKVQSEEEILFYGVVVLNADNAKDTFNLLSANENGVLFTCSDSDCFDEIVGELRNIL